MANFRVGQIVVCVDAQPRCSNIVQTSQRFVTGRIYTIRALDPRHIPYWGSCGLLTEEVRNALVPWNGVMIEPCLSASHFRPVVCDTTKAVEDIKTKLYRVKGRVKVQP